MRAILLIELGLILCALSLPAFGQTIDQAFFQLQKATSDVGELPLSPAQKQLLAGIQSKVDTIQAAASQLPSEDRSPYGRALAHNAKLLRMSVHEADQEKFNGILADVDVDLAIKSSARSGMAMASRFNGKVSVSVNTRRAGSLVNGYIIVLNPMAYSGNEPFVRLEKQSSPAAGYAPPGRYRLIVLRDGVKINQEVVQIGLNAQDSVELDVHIP